MFIGRKKEIEKLKKLYSSSKFESVLIYGRRRVGKTLIIQESLKNSNDIVIHFECKNSSLNSNLFLLTKLFTEKLNLGNINFNTFGDFFEFAFTLSESKKFILIIDEFSFLLERDFSIESFLASSIDMHKEKSLMKLIISGSYVGLMQKMVEYGSHSFGRFNYIMYVKPFSYYESSYFYPNYSDNDKFIAYSVFGGLPYFNALIDDSISIIDNIKGLIIEHNSTLENEIKNTILEETSKISNFNDVIGLIARGKVKQSDLIATIKMNDKTDPKYLLNKMLDMEIIEKFVPINHKTNRKKTFYRFKDNFFAFYYRYIAFSPYSILRNDPDYFFDNYIYENFFKEYLPQKFEDLSREFLLRRYFKLRIEPPIMDIGTYFYDDKNKKLNRQFDVVTKDEKGYISYECKYSDRKIDKSIIKEEEEQTKNLDIDFYKLGFISKVGFENDIDKSKYNCFSLSDFYDEKLK